MNWSSSGLRFTYWADERNFKVSKIPLELEPETISDSSDHNPEIPDESNNKGEPTSE